METPIIITISHFLINRASMLVDAFGFVHPNHLPGQHDKYNPFHAASWIGLKQREQLVREFLGMKAFPLKEGLNTIDEALPACLPAGCIRGARSARMLVHCAQHVVHGR